MSKIWGALSATKLQQQLSDVAKELVASEEFDRSRTDEVLPATPVSEKAAVALEHNPDFDQSSPDILRMRRELELSQADAKRLRSYLLEAQAESELEILALQKQLERFYALQQEYERNKTSLSLLEAQAAQSAEREEAARSALRSIELILANVQSDQEQEIAIRTLHLTRQLEEGHLARKVLEERLSQLQSAEASLLSSQLLASQLQSALEKSHAALRVLELENSALKQSLDKSVVTLSSQADSSELLIDKRIIRSLLLSYFNPSAAVGSKAEVLDIMTRMLSMTESERERLGASRAPPRGWFASFGFGTPDSADTQSLSSLWVQYLAASAEASADSTASSRSGVT